MKKEYLEFMEGQELAPPDSLDRAIKKAVMIDITVPVKTVLKKLFFIHVISALFTLSICPQFGVTPISSMEHGIASLVLSYGTLVCGLFCGAVFMGTTALLSILVFKRLELSVLNKNSLWIFSMLGTFSIAVLMLLGVFISGHHSHLIESYSLVFTLSWLISGILLSTVVVKVDLLLKRLS